MLGFAGLASGRRAGYALAVLAFAAGILGDFQMLALGLAPAALAAFVAMARERRWRAAQKAQLHDVPVRWACRTGVCHNCETGLIAGAVDYFVEPLTPPANGNLLICCSRPRADTVLDL